MIVCSCNVVSDHEVREAVADAVSARKISDIYQHLGHQVHCGRCARSIQSILVERRNAGEDCASPG
jgi:bacterioferritin-associated ferredoxin